MNIISTEELEELIKKALYKQQINKIKFSYEIKSSSNGNLYNDVKFEGWAKHVQNSIAALIDFYLKNTEAERMAELLIRRIEANHLPRLTASEEFELTHLERIFFERQKEFETCLAVGAKFTVKDA